MTEENINTNETNETTNGGDTSVPDILQNLGSEQAALLTSYQDHLTGLAEQRKLPDGAYLDAVDDSKKARLLLDEKLKDASERRAEVKAKYEDVTKAGHERLAARKEDLKEELFDVDTSTTMAVALADDEKLEELVRAAIRSGSSGLQLAKALLPTIHDRGLDELSVPLLENHPTLAASWREYQALPADEVLARQLDPGRIEQVIPEANADRLQVRPRLSAF